MNREYQAIGLAGNLLTGAYCLRDMFTDLVGDDSLDPMEAYESVAAKYKLTENQDSYLRETAEKVSLAKDIVREISKRYGLDESGEIERKSELYFDIFDEHVPDEDLVIRPDSFCIGIHLPKKYFKDNDYGDTRGYLPLTTKELGNELGMLREGRAGEWLFNLFYRARSNGLTEEEANAVRLHETKHIIDKLLSFPAYFKETGANLFSGISHQEGIDRDLERLREKLSEYRKTQEKLEKSGVRMLIESQRRLVGRAEQRLGEAERVANEDIKGLLASGVDGKALSFLLSTIDKKKLPDRIKLVREYIGVWEMLGP